jgi:endogenous inhibitor of DNA gyrase (YacG/DUF329 family)
MERCRTCRAELTDDAPTFPFCSERCRLADLGGWLNEKYRIVGEDDEDDASTPGEGGALS